MVRATASSSAGRSSRARRRRVTSRRPRSGEMLVFVTFSPSVVLHRQRTPSGKASGRSFLRPLRMPYALLVVAARAPVASATASAATAVAAAGTILLRRTRRRVLRPLDQLFRGDHRAVLVLRDELEADPAAGL